MTMGDGVPLLTTIGSHILSTTSDNHQAFEAFRSESMEVLKKRGENIYNLFPWRSLSDDNTVVLDVFCLYIIVV